MPSSTPPLVVPVIDFRRQSMILEWQPADGTWVACDDPPALVHGVALIRASQPNICLYGQGGRLHLQVGAQTCVLNEHSPQLRFSRDAASLGFRRSFSAKSTAGTLLRHAYWNGQGDEFFQWLTARAADGDWRTMNGRRWSEGTEASTLRAS